MPADRTSGDRMPTAEEAEAMQRLDLYGGMLADLWDACEREGWVRWVPVLGMRITRGGRAALAAYRAAHGDNARV